MLNIKSLYNLFAKHPEGRWIMEAPNSQILYQFIKEHPIKKAKQRHILPF